MSVQLFESFWVGTAVCTGAFHPPLQMAAGYNSDTLRSRCTVRAFSLNASRHVDLLASISWAGFLGSVGLLLNRPHPSSFWCNPGLRLIYSQRRHLAGLSHTILRGDWVTQKPSRRCRFHYRRALWEHATRGWGYFRLKPVDSWATRRWEVIEGGGKIHCSLFTGQLQSRFTSRALK